MAAPVTDPGAALEVESELAYVVYNAESGDVVLVHGITTFRGADGRTEQEGEERALELARQMGGRGQELRALAVDPAELEVPGALSVDLDGPRLTRPG